MRLQEIEAEHIAIMDEMRAESLQKAVDGLQAIVDTSRGSSTELITISSDAFVKLAAIDFKKIKSATDAFMQIGQAARGLTDIITSGHDTELKNLQMSKDAELVAAGDNIIKRKKIENDYANKEVQLKKAQAKDRKKQAIVDASISTALAVLNGLTTQPFMPLGLIMSVLAGALGAAQIISIANQPEPQFTAANVMAEGGIIQGASHANGGVKLFTGSGAPVAEVEGGEAMFVLKKDATAEIAALSMINESHGGRSFTSGGNKHLQEGGQVDTSSIDKSVDEAIQRTPIFVQVADIETGMTNFNNTKKAGVI